MPLSIGSNPSRSVLLYSLGRLYRTKVFPGLNPAFDRIGYM